MNSVFDGHLTNNVHQHEFVPPQESGGKLSQGFRDFHIFIISIMNYSRIRNSEFIKNLNLKSKVVGQFRFGLYLREPKFTSPTRRTLKINKKVTLRFEKVTIRDFGMSSIIRC